jgi:hypothetical protein
MGRERTGTRICKGIRRGLPVPCRKYTPKTKITPKDSQDKFKPHFTVNKPRREAISVAFFCKGAGGVGGG